MVGWTRALAADLNPEDELLSPLAPYSQHASLLTPLAAFYLLLIHLSLSGSQQVTISGLWLSPWKI